MSLHASRATVPVGADVRAFLIAVASFMALTLPGLAPAAQHPAVGGGAGLPDVEIDLSVLDELGAVPPVPRLLSPETDRRLGEKIILKPPGKRAAGTPAAPSPPTTALELGPPRPGRAALKPRQPPAERAAIRRPKPPRAPPKPVIAAKGTPEAMAAPKKAPREPVLREKALPPPRLTPPPIAPRPPPAVKSSALPPPAAPAAPKQTAAVAPAPKSWRQGSTLRIAFAGDSTRLPDEAKAELEAVARTLARNSGLRLQLKAYAAGTKNTATRARRLSLSRALKVRSYLIGQGLRSTRIDVRALGNKTEDGPADRVDLLVVRR